MLLGQLIAMMISVASALLFPGSVISAVAF
jgi:hypothetical protein